MSEEKQARPVTDDAYLVRLKRKGKSDEFISAKMGLTLEEVRRKWAGLVEMASVKPESGQSELRQVGLVLSQQLQLLGQSMGIFLQALASDYEPSDLRALIDSCPAGQDLAAYLLTKTIILRPFSMPTPAQLMEAAEKPRPLPKTPPKK
jgi:hypothetical protein